MGLETTRSWTDVFKNEGFPSEVNDLGAFNNYVDKMRGGGGQKMYVFVHAQGIKNVHAGGSGCQKLAKFCPRSC